MLVIAWRGYVLSLRTGAGGIARAPALPRVSRVLSYILLGLLFLLVAFCLVLAVAALHVGVPLLVVLAAAAYLVWKRARRKYYDRRNLEKVVKLGKEMPEQPMAVLLDPGERVELKGHAFECHYAVRVGREESRSVIVSFPRLYLTNKRLIIEGEGPAEGESLEVSIPLEKIVSVRLFDADALIPGLEFKTTLRSPWRHFAVRIPSAAE